MLKDLLLNGLVYPAAWFVFEFIGDRPWLAALILGLLALLVWRFCWPWVRGFHALFGWKGWALLAVAVLTLGAFGAGWRAHRDSAADVHEHPIDKPKPRGDDYPERNPKPIFPGLDGVLKDIFNRK